MIFHNIWVSPPPPIYSLIIPDGVMTPQNQTLFFQISLEREKTLLQAISAYQPNCKQTDTQTEEGVR